MGHWTISSALEPVYVDNPWDDPNYDPRLDSVDCMMCPLTFKQCDNREGCYWDYWDEEDERRTTDGRQSKES